MIRSDTKILNFNGLNLEYTINKKLKNSYIRVYKDGVISLRTPVLNKEYLQNLLLKKEPWIRKQLDRLNNKSAKTINMEDEVLFFGEVISVDMPEIRLLRGFLEKVDSPKSVLLSYDRFYKVIAQDYLPDRVEFYAKIMDLSYSELRLKKFRSRWGSCSSKGVITLNTNMIKLKKEQIDYIVVHELAHLVHFNHSKEFYRLVGNYIPNYKNIQKEIRLA